MNTMRLGFMCGTIILLAACTEEPPPRSVDEFLENRILLEATMVRCGENRNQNKYEAECVNAREASNRIAMEEEEAKRAEIEAQFERKRRSLRRTQDAAAEARRRAAEARRRREEAEYLGVYDDGSTASRTTEETAAGSNNPQAVINTGQSVAEFGQDLEANRE